MKVYKLTSGRDKITGTAANEKFEALVGNSALSSADQLDGGGGFDSIRADLAGGKTAPVMRNIEYGKFYAHKQPATLDLDKADEMLVVSVLWGKDVSIVHADAVRIFRAAIDGGHYVVSDLSTAGLGMFRLAASGPGGEVDLDSASGNAFRFLDVALGGATNLNLGGSAAAARSLDVISKGGSYNSVTFGEDLGASIRYLTLQGNASTTLYDEAGALSHLLRFDAQGLRDRASATIGGDHLTLVTSGRGSDSLTISSLGGDEEAPAEVKLGRGGDWLTLGFMPDASRHFIDGEQGDDRIALSGAAVDLNGAIANFETLSLVEASGLYDVEGVGLDTIELGSIVDDISFAGLAAGASISVVETTSRSLTVEVVGADAATSDVLVLRMHLGADLGASGAGFSAENLSKLTVEATSDGAVLYLTALGAATDSATLEITGGHHVTLRGTEGMATYVANLSVIDGSIDLSSLAGYSNVFLSTGATISGGAKGDVLAGGDGADTIATGDGNNTVLGSLGADEITLGTGADTLVFTAQAQSSNDAAHDTIKGFDADEDVIDLAALANPVEFQGTVASLAAGEATLSANWSGAFFNNADSALYVDIDRDMDIDTSDMRIVLTGVVNLTAWNIDG